MNNRSTGGFTGAASGAAQGAMVAGPWGAAIGGVIGGVSGILSGGAADDAEKLAEEQARFILMESQENMRRMREVADEVVGQARTAVGASNIQFGGTSGQYVRRLRVSADRDIAWERWRSKKQAEFTMEGGQAASQGIMNSMFTQQASGLLSAGADYAAGGGFSGFGSTSSNASGAYMSNSSPGQSVGLPNPYLNSAPLTKRLDAPFVKSVI